MTDLFKRNSIWRDVLKAGSIATAGAVHRAYVIDVVMQLLNPCKESIFFCLLCLGCQPWTRRLRQAAHTGESLFYKHSEVPFKKKKKHNNMQEADHCPACLPVKSKTNGTTNFNPKQMFVMTFIFPDWYWGTVSAFLAKRQLHAQRENFIFWYPVLDWCSPSAGCSENKIQLWPIYLHCRTIGASDTNYLIQKGSWIASISGTTVYFIYTCLNKNLQ